MSMSVPSLFSKVGGSLMRGPAVRAASTTARSGTPFVVPTNGSAGSKEERQAEMDEEWLKFKEDKGDFLQSMAMRSSHVDGYSPVIDEEAGGHAMERHHKHRSLEEMEDRVTGESKDMRQSRSALRFDRSKDMDEAMQAALLEHHERAKAHFQESDDDYEINYEGDKILGSGYTNVGTIKNPESKFVQSSNMKMFLEKNEDHQDGYIVKTAYPHHDPKTEKE